MKKRKEQITVFCVLVIFGVFFLSSAFAGKGKSEKGYRQKLIMFHETVTWDEIEAYAQGWEASGVSVVMDMPLVNGLVLGVPKEIKDRDLENDPRVAGTEEEQALKVPGEVTGQRGSFIRKIERNEKEKSYPWGILKLYGQPFFDLMSQFDEENMPEIVEDALKGIGREKIRIAVFDTGANSHKKGFKFKGGVDIINAGSDSEGKKTGKINKENDDNGHGTHVSGIIGAALDKKFKWGKDADMELYVVKILDSKATGDLSNIIMGLQWAVDNDIDVVNMSIGYREDSPAIRYAIRQAYDAGLVMVAASGNHSNYDEEFYLKGMADGGASDGGASDGGASDGGASDGGASDGGASDGGAGTGGAVIRHPLFPTMFPARYAEVIAVASSDMEGRLAPFSNHDERTDLMAPGTDIVSLDITNGEDEGFGSCSGTSMSAPFVTAAAAMMLAVDPSLTPGEIKSILVGTSDRSHGEALGEISLVRALEEVAFRKEAENPERDKKSKKQREKLKKKIRKTGKKLWN